MSGIGHNSKKTKVGGVGAEALKSLVERIEKLTEEKQALQGDISDIYSEAKGRGYDVRTIRQIVKLRKMNAADRTEQATLLDTYAHALGLEGAFG